MFNLKNYYLKSNDCHTLSVVQVCRSSTGGGSIVYPMFLLGALVKVAWFSQMDPERSVHETVRLEEKLVC